MPHRVKNLLVIPHFILGEVIGLAAIIGVTAMSFMDRIEQVIRVTGLLAALVLSLILCVKGIRDINRTAKKDRENTDGN